MKIPHLLYIICSIPDTFCAEVFVYINLLYTSINAKINKNVETENKGIIGYTWYTMHGNQNEECV